MRMYFYTIIIFKLITLQKMSKNCRLSKNVLLVNVHAYNFFLYNELEAWVLRMPDDSNRIEVWSDIV